MSAKPDVTDPSKGKGPVTRSIPDIHDVIVGELTVATRNQGHFPAQISWDWSRRRTHAVWDSAHDRWDGRKIVRADAH